jgi:VanZ family protein
MGALRRALPWVPSIVYMALIWALSSQSRQIELPSLPWNDKVAHFLEYAILGGLYAYAVMRTWPQLSLLRALAIAAVLTSAWGYTDEIHQAFVPGRNADTLDWVADTLGAIAGSTIACLLDRMRRKVPSQRIG